MDTDQTELVISSAISKPNKHTKRFRTCCVPNSEEPSYTHKHMLVGERKRGGRGEEKREEERMGEER